MLPIEFQRFSGSPLQEDTRAEIRSSEAAGRAQGIGADGAHQVLQVIRALNLLQARSGPLQQTLDPQALGLVAAEVEQDLSFALGVRIEQRTAPQVRIRQAIARDYGLPLERRMLRLLAKLEGKPDPSPSSLPAPTAAARTG